MKAARIHRQGPPEVLVYEDAPVPTPRPGEVLIRNEAAGINFADVERRRAGFYPVPVTEFPSVLGGEFAGVVTAVGDGVSDVKVGDQVFGIISAQRSGCYAQYVAMAAENVFPLPPGIGYADATALLIQGLTAYFLVRDGARLVKDDSILILAAAGGVGSLALQLARIMGAGQIIGAASTPEKRNLVLDLGADATVDYTQPGWNAEVRRLTEGRGVDAALLSGGGEMFSETLACLAPRGRAAVYGSANGELPVVDFAAEISAGRLAMNQTLGFFGLHYYQAYARADLRQALDELAEHVRAERLRLDLGRQFPLSAAAEAHRLLEGRQSTGKLVLLPWAD
ncbi:quinone oxidoreductase [Streptomyces spongiae]|uniref:Quinone oxidoreductase n=2 Tax=Streptomyces spongiae TaxID=565072 RepID=A0A5N8X9T7_9ACTN|nr:quinone oxidoreductase [Streptomyces spongiae]